jgi:hypothetical protein
MLRFRPALRALAWSLGCVGGQAKIYEDSKVEMGEKIGCTHGCICAAVVFLDLCVMGVGVLGCYG